MSETTKFTEYHKRCGDCGRFVERDRWVRKDHPWKEHALCLGCLSKYDGPFDY